MNVRACVACVSACATAIRDIEREELVLSSYTVQRSHAGAANRRTASHAHSHDIVVCHYRVLSIWQKAVAAVAAAAAADAAGCNGGCPVFEYNLWYDML